MTCPSVAVPRRSPSLAPFAKRTRATKLPSALLGIIGVNKGTGQNCGCSSLRRVSGKPDNFDRGVFHLVPIKTDDELDLQFLHRVHKRCAMCRESGVSRKQLRALLGRIGCRVSDKHPGSVTHQIAGSTTCRADDFQIDGIVTNRNRIIVNFSSAGHGAFTNRRYHRLTRS